MDPEYTSHNIEQNIISQLGFFNNLYYYIIGCYRHASGHFVRRENPDSFMLMLCTAGEGFYKCGVNEYSIKRGDMFFCYPEEFTSYGSSDQNPWTVYWVHFNGTGITKLLENYNITTGNAVFHLTGTGEFTYIFDKILSINTSLPNMSAVQYSQSLFYELLFLALKTISAQRNGNSISDIILDSISYINSNISRKISIDDLAGEVNLSKFYFSRLFKKQVGISPNQYIIQQKINLSKNLLQDTNKSISEIALLTGFDNSLYFSGVFKHIVGTSPSNYRKKL